MKCCEDVLDHFPMPCLKNASGLHWIHLDSMIFLWGVVGVRLAHLLDIGYG